MKALLEYKYLIFPETINPQVEYLKRYISRGNPELIHAASGERFVPFLNYIGYHGHMLLYNMAELQTLFFSSYTDCSCKMFSY